MLRHLKKLLVLGLMAAGLQSTWAFSLLGPIHDAEDWQQPVIGYNPQGDGQVGFPYTGDARDLGVRNLGQEYRRNIPILYYSADLNFRDYFGARGVQELDKAFAMLNALTNVSSYSSNLSEFPTDSQRIHFLASSLGLTDLKTRTLHILMEQMGLAPPERYVWALHQRAEFEDCPEFMGYLLVRRNFEIVPSTLSQYQASSYVNQTLYSFFVFEDCGDEDDPSADAIEFPVDPLAPTYTAIANPLVVAQPGVYATSLTRDDVAGLRYLQRTNNINLESPGVNVETFVTNAVSPVPLLTQDLGLLLAQARTNDAAALQALYPGLITTATLTGFQLVTNQIIGLAIIPAPPYAPAYSFVITQVTNSIVSIVPTYQHTFANVITNQFSSHSLVTIQTIGFGNDPYASAYLPPTLRVTSRTYLTNQPSGSFYLIPDGFCAVTVLSNILTTVVTNVSTLVATNDVGATNVGGIFFFQNTLTYFTNQALAYIPISCETDLVGQYQGVERVRFVHANDELVDPLTGLYVIPITSEYTVTAFNPTNGTLSRAKMRRVVTQPDFLFTASDLVTGGPDGDAFFNLFMNAVGVPFNTDNVLPGLAGPGTIDSSLVNTVITYNNGGPFFIGLSPNIFFLDTAESFLIPILNWGAFDGSTNAPVVFPNGTSIEEFEYLRLLQISPTPPFFPGGAVGIPFSQQVTAANAVGPVTWSFAPGTPGGLPTGLTLAPDGTISGTPTTAGTYDFALRMTDGIGRFIDIGYAITINP